MDHLEQRDLGSPSKVNAGALGVPQKFEGFVLRGRAIHRMAKDRGYLGTALERNRRWPAPDVGLGEPLTLLLGNKLLDFDAREDSWDSRDGKIPGGVGDTTPNTITTRQSSPHASGVADTHPLYRIGPLRGT